MDTQWQAYGNALDSEVELQHSQLDLLYEEMISKWILSRPSK